MTGPGEVDPAEAVGSPVARAARRAPRLTADQRLAGYVTRRGRFRAVDPARGTPPPGLWRWVGALGWAVLVGDAYRRAMAAHERDERSST